MTFIIITGTIIGQVLGHPGAIHTGFNFSELLAYNTGMPHVIELDQLPASRDQALEVQQQNLMS